MEPILSQNGPAAATNSGREPRLRGSRARSERLRASERAARPLSYRRQTFVAGMMHRNEKGESPAFEKLCSSPGAT